MKKTLPILLLILALGYLPSCKNEKKNDVRTHMDTDMGAVPGYDFGGDIGFIAEEDFVYTPTWLVIDGQFVPDFGYGPGVYPVDLIPTPTPQ